MTCAELDLLKALLMTPGPKEDAHLRECALCAEDLAAWQVALRSPLFFDDLADVIPVTAIGSFARLDLRPGLEPIIAATFRDRKSVV